MSAPRPAATVLVLRDGAGVPEVLLMQRARSVGFFPDAWVFPGGRVEERDRAIPVDGEGDPELRPFLAAAARECLEEAGIWLGVGGARDLRRRLAEGDGRVEPEELRVDGGGLALWAWWITPPEEPRRYDTRFVLARLPEGAEEASPDGGEAVRLAWFAPTAALRAHERGELPLAPPTWCSLFDLAAFSTVEQIFDRCRSEGRPRPLEPRLVGGALGEAMTCVLLPGDEEHPDPQARFPFSRLCRQGARWVPQARFRCGPGERRAAPR